MEDTVRNSLRGVAVLAVCVHLGGCNGIGAQVLVEEGEEGKGREEEEGKEEEREGEKEEGRKRKGGREEEK